ncbi:ATP/GTP-binding protein [Promicromonospora sukumoe]|uniref:ATP/GTP-binding protein n=1 Tax=Promicromonospora sukumoe TaxID=88382 RepID=UPI0037CA961C
MILLRFRVENHRSIRDEAELSLVQPSLTTVRPKDGDWVGATTRVAGIYGANASGKSTVVDALKFFRATIVESATSWGLRKTIPQKPYLLDPDSKSSASGYAVDVVLGSTRYQYGFEIDARAVRHEWLYDYPSTKHRVLFERDGQEFSFGRSLIGAPRRHASATGERELFLSKAKSNGHELLGTVWSELVDGLVIADFSEQDRRLRLDQITEGIADGDIDLHDVTTLLQVADIGITEVAIDEPETSDGSRPARPGSVMQYYMVRTHLPSIHVESHRESGKTRILLTEKEELKRALTFQHLGFDGTFPLPVDAQSTGTLSWLSLALPALTILRKGGVLIVDEIDASLHPQLSQVILRMFKDPDYNHTGAQLIFTTHDTYLLSNQSDSALLPEETWFTEKHRDGATSLFSLADFPTRDDQNFAKRYLDGRYGGVPRTARSFLASLLDPEARETTDA